MTEKVQNGVSEQLLLLLGGQPLSGNPRIAAMSLFTAQPQYTPNFNAPQDTHCESQQTTHPSSPKLQLATLDYLVHYTDDMALLVRGTTNLASVSNTKPIPSLTTVARFPVEIL